MVRLSELTEVESKMNDFLEVQKIRETMLKMGHNTQSLGAHFGGGLSLVEILYVLFKYVMKFDVKDIVNAQRDRLVFSKGHGTLALYPIMAKVGIITEQELFTYKLNDTRLTAHPSRKKELGFDLSTGSLGQGLSMAVGMAIALKMNQNNHRVFVILGDGECDEGQVWEAAMLASHKSLTNLVVIVDYNKIQYDGNIDQILRLEPFSLKWESFGWNTLEVDGHNIEELIETFRKLDHSKPNTIIAHTVKGKGISFMEGNPKWHHGVLTDEKLAEALNELNEELS